MTKLVIIVLPGFSKKQESDATTRIHWTENDRTFICAYFKEQIKNNITLKK